MVEKITIYDLFESGYELRETAVRKLLNFLGLMLNDQVFGRFNTISFYNDLPKFLKLNHMYSLDSSLNLQSFHELFVFTFHAGSLPLISKLLQESEPAFDWNLIFRESFKILMEYTFKQLDDDSLNKEMFDNSYFRIRNILCSALSVIDIDDPKLFEFVNDFASISIIYELSLPFSRVLGDKYDDPKRVQNPMYHVTYFLYEIVNKISDHNIFTIKPLQLLNELFGNSMYQS